MKFAIWALIICLVIAWVSRAKKTRRAVQHPAPDAKTAAPEVVELMVKCGHCGTYVPASQSVSTPEASFCSEEHRREQGQA